MSVSNPRSRKLVVIKIEYKDGKGVTNFLFPLNPAEFSETQVSRVSSVFTYGEKVFQNLGRGLKTVTISGHTGFRLDYNLYGIFSSPSGSDDSLASIRSGSKLQSNLASQDAIASDGARLFLDLKSIIQLIKGENIFLKGPVESQISENFSVENLDKISKIQLILPDQSMVYDVLLQNDLLMRSKDQPHLYKYQLTFIVTNESIRKITSRPTEAGAGFVLPIVSRLNSIKESFQDLGKKFDNVKNDILSQPEISTAVNAYNALTFSVGETIQAFSTGLLEVNTKVNDLRRLESLNNVLKQSANAISNIRSSVQILKSFVNATAFYETKILANRVLKQSSLLFDQFKTNKEELAFRVNLQRLASVDVPITIAANKAVIAFVRKDVEDLIKSGFVIPIDKVTEIDTEYGRKISIIFSQAPSSLDISDIKVFAINDYSRSNNLVFSLTDSEMILSSSFHDIGRIFDFQIEYNYRTFEQIGQSRYKSVRRVLIKDGDDFDSILKRYAPTELEIIPSYSSEVAYLNKIEFPYIVTRFNSNYTIYQGSHAFVEFTTNADFLKYISNVTITGTEGPLLPLYTYENVKDTFLIDETDLKTALLPSNKKFFVVLFKDTYSSRVYALFGIMNDYASNFAYIFQADQYFLIAVEKGKSYDVIENVIWEILSPYTITDDLIDFYGQREFLESLSEDDLFTRNKLVIQKIYESYIGLFSSDSFVFTVVDKQFLAGDVDNKQYALLTNFLNFPSASSYDVISFKKFKILTDKDHILLPSLSDRFLSFQNAVNAGDVYKTDLNLDFIKYEIIHPRPDISSTSGEIDFRLINKVENVKQALYHRLVTPKGALKLHLNYGLPQLIGKKNTLENLIMLKYNVFEQVTSDNRVKVVSNISANSSNDILSSDVSAVLVNDDEVSIR